MTQTQIEGSNSWALYETDFYSWTQEQAKFLRDGVWNSLDIPNLVEEIESLGRQDRRELRNRLRVLIGHLLKWEYQSGKRSRSWLNTIQEQRYQIHPGTALSNSRASQGKPKSKTLLARCCK